MAYNKNINPIKIQVQIHQTYKKIKIAKNGHDSKCYD